MRFTGILILAVFMLVDPTWAWGRAKGSHNHLGGHFVSGSISVETREGSLFDNGYGDSGGGLILQLGYGRFVRYSPLLVVAVFESNSQRQGDLTVQDWAVGPRLTLFTSRRWVQGEGKPFLSAAWLYQNSHASLRGAELSGGGSSLRVGLGWFQILGDALVGTLEVNYNQDRMHWSEVGDEAGRRVVLRIGLAGVIDQTWR
jgi:hypothetical protein